MASAILSESSFGGKPLRKAPRNSRATFPLKLPNPTTAFTAALGFLKELSGTSLTRIWRLLRRLSSDPCRSGAGAAGKVRSPGGSESSRIRRWKHDDQHNPERQRLILPHPLKSRGMNMPPRKRRTDYSDPRLAMLGEGRKSRSLRSMMPP